MASDDHSLDPAAHLECAKVGSGRITRVVGHFLFHAVSDIRFGKKEVNTTAAIYSETGEQTLDHFAFCFQSADLSQNLVIQISPCRTPHRQGANR